MGVSRMMLASSVERTTSSLRSQRGGAVRNAMPKMGGLPSLTARTFSIETPYYPPRLEDMLKRSQFEDITVTRRTKKLAKLRRRGKGPPKKGSGKRSKRK